MGLNVTLDQRRDFLMQCGAALATAGAFSVPQLALADETAASLRGQIHHSVCRWTFSHLSLPELCQLAKRIGFAAIDLVGPKEWDVLKAHGMHSSMCNGAELGLKRGWNDPQWHATLIRNYLDHIDLVADAGYQNLILFSGNRQGMDDAKGLSHCVDGIKQIIAKAEKRGVILHMEILNSRVDHRDYMADSSEWAAELCQRVGSPNLKMLFDIYHVQISQGDVIRRIQQYAPYIGHYHTGGVPGRGEISAEQELNYRAIMKAIVATGFKGHVAQEFMPAGSSAEEKAASLQRAILLCDV